MINVIDYVILVLFIYIKCEYILDWNKMWSEIYFLKKLFNLLIINVWKKLNILNNILCKVLFEYLYYLFV